MVVIVVIIVVVFHIINLSKYLFAAHKDNTSPMPCQLDFGNDFACPCSPLNRPISMMMQKKEGEEELLASYYLPQMRVCHMIMGGRRLIRFDLASSKAWGACFCKQYFEETKCQAISQEFCMIGVRGREEIYGTVIKLCFSDGSVLENVATPLCIWLILVPIQRCVRRFLKHRRVLRQKALYWATAMKKLCAQSIITGEGEEEHHDDRPTVSSLALLHSIASNEDLIQMITQMVTAS